VNDFDNAIVNSKNSLSIYNKLREGDIENDVVVDEARAFNTIAALYKKAGGQREADTFYQKVIKVYQLLASTYPESFTPILAQAMTEYAELQKWFDRDARYDSLLHVVIALREKISKSAYPFSKLAYAESLGRLAQKISNFDMKIFLAEEQWQKEKDLLTPIAPAHLLILGNEYCTTLSKLGGVKIALKNTDEAIPFFAQSLAFREQSFRLAPLNNKRAMLDLLTQNATLNALNKKYEIAVEQLARAKVYADDLGDDKYAKQIADYRNEILRK
jgi:hypothetical protein